MWRLIRYRSLNGFIRWCRQTVTGCRGLRINPEYLDVETDLYNPCALVQGWESSVICSRYIAGRYWRPSFAVMRVTSYDLEKTLAEVEKRFGRFLPHIKWLNMGGGHLMTRKGTIPGIYFFVAILQSQISQFGIIMEPGAVRLPADRFYDYRCRYCREPWNKDGYRRLFYLPYAGLPEMPYKLVIQNATDPQEGKLDLPYRWKQLPEWRL